VVASIKVNGWMTRSTARAQWGMPMGTFTRVAGRGGRDLAKGAISTPMGISILAAGRMIPNQVWERSKWQRAILIRVAGRMARKMAGVMRL